MTLRQVLGRDAPASRGLEGIQESTIGGSDVGRQGQFVFRRFADLEVWGAALLDADEQDGAVAVAAHRFKMRLDDARDSVEALFGVALGAGQEVAFLDA